MRGAALILLVLAVPAWGQGSVPDRLAYLGWLKDLAGACWQGADAEGKPTDRQCYELQYGQFLRGTIEVPGAGQPPRFQGDSLYRRGAEGRIAFLTWASNGAFQSQEAFHEGERIVFPLAVPEGRPARRTSWTREGPDAFGVAVEEKSGERWTPLRRVGYARVK